MEYAITVEHLKKSYGDVCAVDDISFSVKKGSLFAFLGVNGAGKSTTINIISSILQKDGGRVEVEGYDLDRDAARIKRQTGIVFQSSVLDKQLTVEENLEIRASFYSFSRAERRENIQKIVELLSLQPILKRPVRNLSGGQQRRVDIARAMVHRPALLILDEPSTGLDPKSRLAVWSLIDEIRAETGMTVFLTTHYLEEADQSGEVVIMDQGKIIAQGSPNELKNRYSNDRLLCYGAYDAAFEEKLRADGYRTYYDAERGALNVAIGNSGEAKKIMRVYEKETSDVEIIKGTMDDVFLAVTGKVIRGAEENHADGEA